MNVVTCATCLNLSKIKFKYSEKYLKLLYPRVSHIKLDRVNGSKLRFQGKIRKFKKNESI